MTKLAKQYLLLFFCLWRFTMHVSLSLKISPSCSLPMPVLLQSLSIPISLIQFPFVSVFPVPLSSPLSHHHHHYNLASSFLKATCSPARLAQLHPANEGLFIGLRLSAAKRGLDRADTGANHIPPPTSLLPLLPNSDCTAHSTCLLWSGPVAYKEITCLCCP